MATALYKQILEQLISKIESGEYKYGDKIPTENKLSEEYFVSRITSRRTLNELAALGYVTRSRRSGTFVKYINPKPKNPKSSVGIVKKDLMVIGLILPFNTSNYDGHRCLEGVLDVTNQNNCYTIVQNSLSNYRNECQIIENFISDNIRGIIYYPVNSENNFNLMARLEMEKYPIVTIDKHFTDTNISSVVSDNMSGSAEVTKYLIELGHKNIAFASDVPVSTCSSLRDRFKGFLSVLSENNISFNPHDIFEARQMSLDDDAALDNIYAKRINTYMKKAIHFINDGVTAVQCSTDTTALQLYKGCQAAGIRIPDDLSICGFDGLPSANEIKLTTTKQDFYQIGANAAKILLDKIANPDLPKEIISIPVTLQKGKSIMRIGPNKKF